MNANSKLLLVTDWKFSFDAVLMTLSQIASLAAWSSFANYEIVFARGAVVTL